ncbi:g4220 [Coccomyxa elongata]
MYWDALQMAQQELDRLRGNLERVEQDIQASEQELREVTKAKKLPEIIAVIRKRKDRLVSKKKDMRQQLSALQTQLISPAGTSSLTEEQLFERIEPQLKRHFDEEFARRSYKRECSGFTISLPVENVDDERLWQHLVVDGGVPCAVVPINVLLLPGRSILAQLRYLRFLLMEAKAVPLSSIVAMPRPDLRICINGQPKYPAECKAKYGLAHEDSPDGIASNRAGLSKLLKAVLSLHGKEPSGKHICLYFSRSEYVWVAVFLFGTPGKLTRVRVSPAFPQDPQLNPPRGRLMDLAQLGKLSSTACLSDLLPPAMPSGFGLLVQYTDTLCELEGIEKVQLTASWMKNQPVDFTHAQVIASSRKSMVVRLTPASDSVVRISMQQLIAHECELNLTLDGRSQHLRRMTGSGQYAELSSGVLPGLAMLELAGFGKPLQSHHMEPGSLGMGLVWDQASEGLSAMHAAGVLHRDPKPSNLLVIDGVVKLSDFDISCRMEDESARQNLDVGTPEFLSSKLAQRYEERDDYLALALALLKLAGIDIADKRAAMESASDAGWLPKRKHTSCSLWLVEWAIKCLDMQQSSQAFRCDSTV